MGAMFSTVATSVSSKIVNAKRFPPGKRPRDVPGAVDRRLSDAMTSYWAAFARTGNPSARGLPAWPRYTGVKGPVLHLDETIAAKPDTRRPRYEALYTYMNRPR